MNFLIPCYNFIMEIGIIFFASIIFSPIKKYKIFKSKEDQLFIQKMILILSLFTIDVFSNCFRLLGISPFQNGGYKIQQYIFNILLVLYIFYNLFLSLELYKTYNNPVHLFVSIFKQKKHNYIYEIFIIIFAIITFIVDYFFLNEPVLRDCVVIEEKSGNETVNETTTVGPECVTIFTMNDKWKWTLIAFISLISVIICLSIKSKISKFAFRNQEKLLSVIKKSIFRNLFFLGYGIAYGLVFLLKGDNYDLLNNLGGCVFVLLSLLDIFTHLSVISISKFTEYKLKKCLISYFVGFFKKEEKIEDNLVPLVNESTTNDFGLSTTSFQGVDTTTSVLVSNNPYDKELISMYANDIYVEDYWLNYFDQIINITTSSLFQVYCSKFFSTKELANKRLSNDIEIAEDLSGIGTINNLSTTNLGNNPNIADENSKVGEYTCSFDLCKSLIKDDYLKFKDILESGIESGMNAIPVRTKVKSFYTPKCVYSIAEQNLKSKQIGISLLSHMIINNSPNKNPDNPNASFWSLTASNGKEEYFNKSTSTCIKTYDKNFNLDIFDTNDDDIDLSNKNKGISSIIDKYFNYIKGKGMGGTFLPILVGLFKIKINSFKTLLIFITRNSLVENAPKNFFTYWQLIRFLNDGPKKIASSQFNSGGAAMVKDDPIFERMFQVETKNENPNYNKVILKNFSEFQETVSNDIKFLKGCDINNFNLLLMYYEYENTQKHEKQGIIKIQKTDENKAEIIAESLPKGALFEESQPSAMGSMLKNDMFSFSPSGGFFGDDDSGDKISGIGKNIGAVNLMDYSEKVNINAFEGLFDSFNCMCFFTFENIFDVRNNKNLTTNYYTSFLNKILSHFTQFKEKGKK